MVLPTLRSHPMWVRGLKPFSLLYGNFDSVAPYVGAWIETSEEHKSNKP